MNREQIPITSDVVTWARTRAGYSIEEASALFRKISEWESGESYPSYPQLEDMAEKFKIPIAVFFFPEPPPVPEVNESFRTLNDTDFNSIPKQIKFLLRKGKAFQLNLAELSPGGNQTSKEIIHDLEFSKNSSIESVANKVREYIGVTIEEQISWSDNEEALKHWRKAFHEVGVYVFKDAFKVKDYFGFCLYDKIFPIIYVNNSAAKSRQIFTLFHELSHLLFHTSGIDVVNSDFVPNYDDEAKRIEVFCNKLAAEILLPESVFNLAINNLEANESSAELLADKYHVSREYIFRRFLDRGLINEGKYSLAASRWAKQKKKGSGGDHYWSKIAYLGRDYMTLAFSEYYKDRINFTQLADYLDTKPKNLNVLEEYYIKGA